MANLLSIAIFAQLTMAEAAGKDRADSVVYGSGQIQTPTRELNQICCEREIQL